MKIIIKIVKKSNDNIWENQTASINFKSLHTRKHKDSTYNNIVNNNNNEIELSEICNAMKTNSMNQSCDRNYENQVNS